MRIAVVIHSLSAGGGERVASTLINAWVEAGEKVTLVTLAAAETDFYKVRPEVRRLALNLDRESSNWRECIGNNARRIRALRRAFLACGCDVIVSFIDKTNVLVLLSALGLNVPIVVSEQIDPRMHELGKIAAWLRRRLYPRARTVVIQTSATREWAEGIVRGQSICVIPSAISEQFAGGRSPRDGTERYTALAMGRMEAQKGFDLLLRAFLRCAPRHPNWTLRIVGEGSQREYLRAEARRLGLESRIILDTITTEPENVFGASDLFVLSSHYEGFPMVLLEAMACGLPVVSFDCPSGPREMIRDGVDGVLVPAGDVGALAEAMDRLMTDEHERRRLAVHASEVQERFGLVRVMGMWNEVLTNALERGPARRGGKNLATNRISQDA